jgi:hypothetical protein
MCLFFDPYAFDDQRRYASRHAYVSSQKPKRAHFLGRRNLFLFSQEHHTFFGQSTSLATTLATTSQMLL